MNFEGSDNTLSISDSVINSNIGRSVRGGMALHGGALTITVTVERTTIAGNQTTNADGAAAVIYANSDTGSLSATFRNCFVTGNSSDVSYGGEFWVAGATVDIFNCTISGNVANYGGGINVSSGTVTVTNSI